MIFNIEEVSIPGSHGPFEVGKNTVIDDISGLGKGTNTIADILSTGYEFDAYGDSGVGTYYCDLGIGSLYDYLVYENLNVYTIEELSCTPPLI